jgi:hypothetical protein
LEPQQVVVAFSYRVSLDASGPKIASVAYSPEPAQFATLAQRMLTTSAEVLAMLPKPRRLQRIGIVATGRVQRNAPPPGLTRLIEYIGAPWGRAPIACTARISTVLDDGAKTQEKCHHSLQFEDGAPDGVVQFTLDWQRFYSEAAALTASELSKRASTCLDDAVRYFEKFGAGDLNYGD